MSVKEHKLWKLLCQKSATTDNSESFITAVWEICQFGMNLSKTIRDTFKTYTLHDEIHICNVMTHMLNIVGNGDESLTRDECAMLIMAACCHDIGMSISEDEKEYLKSWPDCIQIYLASSPEDYNIAHEKGIITDEIIQHYVRSEHHKRVGVHLMNQKWPEALGVSISVKELIAVCESHGEDVHTILELGKYTPEIDLLLCAVLLRLGDILDFDATRAPDSLYRYINLAQLDGMENKQSYLEWEKHKASRGFSFVNGTHQEILYRAECSNIRIEQAIVSYLNWVDRELSICKKMVDFMDARWNSLEIPLKVERQITATGYLSGEYKLTLDQERVLDLLIGRELYSSDPSVFVRELLQNAIDAVRTRKQLDKNLSRNWKPQISIRTWMDMDGYYWFRIEDNGIGMTEEMIREYFLRVGHSYYNSEQFKADKIRCEADENYKPVSRFGIGILSCFMGDAQNTCVEMTTKHYPENGRYSPAYRMSIKGLDGYYYLTNEAEHRTVAPDMPDDRNRKQKFISESGTIIAVRTNPYQAGNSRSFKDILDQYIVYPEIPIHYEGLEGIYDYQTEQDFMDAVHELTPFSPDGTYEALARFPLPEQDFQEMKEKYPDYIWTQKPEIAVYCIPLDYFTDSALIKGATVFVNLEGKGSWCEGELAKEHIPEIYYGIRYNPEESDYTLWTAFGLPSYSSGKELEASLLPELQRKLSQSHIKLDLHKDASLRRNVISALQVDKLDNIAVSKVRAYQAVVSNHTLSKFPSKQVEGLEWFQKWFFGHVSLLNEQKIFHNTSVNAHNGILSDTSVLLPFGTNFLQYTILMLKDEYGPELNLSRSMIYKLPLELSCELELIANQIQCFLIENRKHRGYREPWISEPEKIPMQDYWKIISKKTTITSDFLFTTETGDMTLLELAKILEEKEKVIMHCGTMGAFQLSILLRSFDLQINQMDSDGITICAVKKKSNALSDETSFFYPGLFLYPHKDSITKLGVLVLYADSDIAFSFAPYNASHPFSRWLLQNREVLEKSVPGIYYQILRQLWYGRNLIKHINLLLGQLRSLSHLKIKIADDLSEEEFFILKRE